MSDEKKLSPTDVYKNHLQAIIYDELGVKVSRDKAWKLFKAIINGTVQHVAKIDGNKMSLAGIGTFKINKSVARGAKAGLDKDGNPVPGAKIWPFVPRFRFSPSSVINTTVDAYFGLGDNAGMEFTDYGIYKKNVDVEIAEEQAPAPSPEAPKADPVDDFFNL